VVELSGASVTEQGMPASSGHFSIEDHPELVIATRDCEHFAFWSATGLSTSRQVEALLYGGAALPAASLAGSSPMVERVLAGRSPVAPGA